MDAIVYCAVTMVDSKSPCRCRCRCRCRLFSFHRLATFCSRMQIDFCALSCTICPRCLSHTLCKQNAMLIRFHRWNWIAIGTRSDNSDGDQRRVLCMQNKVVTLILHLRRDVFAFTFSKWHFVISNCFYCCVLLP